MGIVGTDIGYFIAKHALETNPDIRLDITQQVSKVYRPIGKGEGVGNKDFALAQFKT